MSEEKKEIKEIKEMVNELEKLNNKYRKEVLNKISNTTPGKLSDDQFKGIVTSARHIEDDFSKIIKNFKKITRSL